MADGPARNDGSMTRLSLLLLLVFGAAAARAQAPSTNTPPEPVVETPHRKWSFSASASAYFVPDAREYVQPTFAADRDGLHLEARYNYENLETGSAWVGRNFGGG